MADEREVPKNFHALYDRGFRAARGTPMRAARADTAGHARMRAEVPGLEVVYDDATQLPKRVAVQQPEARLSAARAGRAGGSPEDAVMEFVQDRGDLWNLSADDAATVEVVSVSRRGLPTVQLVQRVGGTEVFNSEVKAAVDRNNQRVSLAGQLFPGVGAA